MSGSQIFLLLCKTIFIFKELDSSINYNPEELICGGCSSLTGGASANQICGRHGAEYLEYKCRFCCSVAVYFWYIFNFFLLNSNILSFGTTHFCAGCHSDFQRLMTLTKAQMSKCPAGPKSIQVQNIFDYVFL